MFTRLERLFVHCRKSTEEIQFADITWFHGQISSGKSTILRLVDYCLGGDLVVTPAVNSEFLAAELHLEMGNYQVHLKRERGHNRVMADWVDRNGEFRQALAPIDEPENAKPIVADNVFTLSDLIMFFHELPPIKVRKNKYDPESRVVRLSIRDFLWFCYLAEIDQDVFRLDADYKQAKARDVYRFIFGFYNHEIAELEERLARIRQNRNELTATAKGLEAFLAPHGFATTGQIRSELLKLEEERSFFEARLKAIQNEAPPHHPIEDLQRKCRAALELIAREERALEDSETQIKRRTRIRAELITALRKLDRLGAATAILGDIEFADCPRCGRELPERDTDQCVVCGQSEADTSQPQGSSAVERSILVERIGELDAELEVLTTQRARQFRVLEQARANKEDLDHHLESMTSKYDPPRIAALREAEHQLGRLNGRVALLRQLSSIPEEIEQLRENAASLQVEMSRVEGELKEARAKAVSSPSIIQEYEETFLRTLIDVHFPHVSSADHVELDYGQSWRMWVYPQGDRQLGWYLGNVSSSGKKTLYNATLTLALHHVTQVHGLPLPTLIMLDSPMKNIGKDVNRDIMLSFYEKLYRMASDSLKGTQIIVVDKEFVPPSSPAPDIMISHRYMTPDDPAYPPLISYYRGH